MLETDTRHGLRNYTIVKLFAGTGPRSSELRFMRLEHLNELDKSIVKIPDEGKTGTRTIWVTDALVTDLKRWLRAREKFAKTDRVFVADNGKTMGAGLIPQIFSKASKRTGITTGHGALSAALLLH